MMCSTFEVWFHLFSLIEIHIDGEVFSQIDTPQSTDGEVFSWIGSFQWLSRKGIYRLSFELFLCLCLSLSLSLCLSVCLCLSVSLTLFLGSGPEGGDVL